MMFSYEDDFKDNGNMWHENTWSKRLCGVLASNYTNNGKYKVNYTAPQGTVIYHNKKKIFYHKFHGSLDILVEKKKNKKKFPKLL